MSNKIVINSCYGGFALSVEAEQWLKDNYQIDDYNTLYRHDPRLVECVESLGINAGRRFSRLAIVEIPGNIYKITEYDGLEGVEVPEDPEWIIIK